MFTGIVTDLGRVLKVERRGDTRFVIATAYDVSDVAIGASVACSGACLTVVDKAPGQLSFDASAETLSKTTLGRWQPGSEINLERALSLGDELGGHLVSGHVDATGTVESLTPEGDSWRFRFLAPASVGRFLAPKGSVAVDGVSLTVNEVEDQPDGSSLFGVNIIAHTYTATAFHRLTTGMAVNLEIDLIARYLARLVAKA
ncbi:MAG: riboflavin synthase [Rhodospirillales bacterium]